MHIRVSSGSTAVEWIRMLGSDGQYAIVFDGTLSQACRHFLGRLGLETPASPQRAFDV